MNTCEKLVMNDGTTKVDEKWFRSIIGGLMYLTQTCSDVMFPVSLVSRFMHNPSKHHLGVTKRVLRYIYATADYGIWYKPISDFKLVGFTDNDWAGFVDDKKSISGYIFSLSCCSRSSKKQATIALSSSEADIPLQLQLFVKLFG
ncbi:secreted RxLR effector protein 161-like [Pistacia vera]|uniref:secreted RxLR effector protein 161-like n=1 Tax=Pistacia vera TaxID=55513 RepID=UPI001263E5C2|nr:secreted RxLR effector protein 161-like [Pistacia vera]